MISEEGDKHQKEQNKEKPALAKSDKPEEKVQETEKAEIRKKEKSSAPSLTPLVDMNLNSIIAKSKEETSRQQQAAADLSVEKLEEVWSKYAQGVSSQSTKTAMTHTVLFFEEDTLTVYVPNRTTQSILQDEPDLHQKLKDISGMHLKIKFLIDKNRFPEYAEVKQERPLSSTDKLKILYNENNAFKMLVDTFELKPKENN